MGPAQCLEVGRRVLAAESEWMHVIDLKCVSGLTATLREWIFEFTLVLRAREDFEFF